MVVLAGGASRNSFPTEGMSPSGPLVDAFLIGVLGAGGMGFYLLRYSHRVMRFAWAVSYAEGPGEPRNASPDPEN